MRKISLLFLGLFALLVSCKKNEVSVNQVEKDVVSNEGIQLRNGALVFNDPDAFFDVIEKLGTKTKKERDEWEKSIGFVSLRAELNQVFEKLDSAKDETEYNNIIANNSDFVVVENGMVKPIIYSNTYAMVLNKEGIFYIGETIHKVYSNKLAFLENGTPEEVDAILNGSEDKSNIRESDDERVPGYEEIDIPDYDDGGGSGGGSGSSYQRCGSRHSAYIEHNRRKCDFEVKVRELPCNACCGERFTRYVIEMVASNYKKNLWGNWKSYYTNTYIEDVKCVVNAPKVTGYDGLRSIFHYENVTKIIPPFESPNDVSRVFLSYNLGDRVQNIYLKPVTFESLYAKGKNRGVGLRWAIINCRN